MSADDFQSQYASVMESMLQSAVAQTTRLFETMVNELKLEISSVRRENQDLKTRCRQFEEERRQQGRHAEDRAPYPGRLDEVERCDKAVQCDLGPSRTVLEQCQPSRISSLQNHDQQNGHEDIDYTLQDHDYESQEEPNSQKAFTLVNEEFASKQEEEAPSVGSVQVCSNEAGSPQASLCGIENEKTLITQESSTEDETPLAVEVPCLVTNSSLQGAQNQSAAVRKEMEEKSEDGHISKNKTQTERQMSDKNILKAAQHQSEVAEAGQPSVPHQWQRLNKQLRVTLQKCADVQSTVEQITQMTPLNKGEESDELNNSSSEDYSQPDLPVLRRRGRPPKKTKNQKQPAKELLLSPPSDIRTGKGAQTHSPKTVKEIEGSSTVDTVNIASLESLIEPNGFPINLSVQEKENTASEEVENSKVVSLAVPVISLTKTCSSQVEKSSETQKCSIEMGERTVHAPSTIVSFTSETLQTPSDKSLKSEEHQTSATIQDAILLVEAMNQPTLKSTSSKQETERLDQTQCAFPVGTSQSAHGVPAKQQIQPLSAEILKVPVSDVSTGVQSIKEKYSAAPKISDATSTTESGVKPKSPHPVILSETTTSSISSSTATQTSVQSLQQHPPRPLIKWLAPSEQDSAVPPKVIVVSRPSSLMSHKITALSPSKIPSVMSIAQNNGILPGSSAESFPFEKPLPTSQKINCASTNSVPVATSQATSPSKDSQSGSPQQPKIIIIPKVVPPTTTNSSKTCVLTIKDTVAPVTLSSPRELRFSVDTHNTFDQKPPIPFQKKGNTTGNLRSQRIFSKALNGPTKTCSSLNMSLRSKPVLRPVKVPLSTVVRLTRRLFPTSSKESDSFLGLPTCEQTQTQSDLKEGTSHKTPPDMESSSTDISADLKESYFPLSLDTSQMSKETNVNPKDSLSYENNTALEECPNTMYVQPSTPSKVPATVLEKSSIAVTVTEPSAVPGMASEPTSNVNLEITSIPVHDYATDSHVEERQPAAVIHLSSTKGSEDATDPHLQMTKTQFLAQLAVSPVLQDPNEATSNDSFGASASCAVTSTREQKAEAIMVKLQSHLKTRLQTKRTKSNRETCTEIETEAAPLKKPRSEEDSQTDNKSNEHFLICSESQGTGEDGVKLKTEACPQTPTQFKDGLRSRRSLSEPASVSEGTSEGTPLTLRRGRLSTAAVGFKKKKSTSVSTRQSSSGKESAASEKTRNSSVNLRKSSSTKDNASTQKTKISYRTSLTRAGTSPKNTKTGLSPNDRTSVRTERIANPKNIKLSSVSPKASRFDKGTSPLLSSNESSYVRRKCTFKIASYSTNPRSCNITADGTNPQNEKRKTGSPGSRWPQWVADVSPRKAEEFTLNEKDKTVDMDMHVSKLSKRIKIQNVALTAQLAENSQNSTVVKKCKAKGIWTPPQLTVNKTTFTGGKRSTPFTIKKETVSPKSQNHTVVYPASVSLNPIPFKAPPVVSPLEPLSVIGRRLLKNQCGECGRILSSSAALESHVSLHTGHRPFSCMLCGKHFVDSKGLKRHDRVHRNGRIHICQECGKGFVYRFGLTKHLQMVHGRIKPHTCPICNKAFFTNRDMDTHKRIHTGEKPFHCNLCEKKFARRVELNMHLRWHNGEKRHWCPYCGKGFLDPNNLKRHKYTHTGERPHSCPHCPKKFTQSGHLKKHVRNVHKMQREKDKMTFCSRDTIDND